MKNSTKKIFFLTLIPALLMTACQVGSSASAKASTALTNLIDTYKSEGFTQALDSDSNVVSYRTRAFTHKIYEKNGIYADFSFYSSEDYTFLGSDDFTYRIEVLIYPKSNYKGVHYESDMSAFNSCITKEAGADFTIDFALPSDVKIELYKGTSSSDLIDYGYGYNTDCFLYGTSQGSNASDIVTSLQSSLADAGYTLLATTSKGNLCYEATMPNGTSNYLTLIINSASNYVRLEIGLPGTRF